MTAWVAIAISGLALLVSAFTAWLTLFRRGELRMTQPTVIFFGPDSGRNDRLGRLKVYLRTLLYSTSRRGQTVESVHVNLQRGESKQNFSIWVYGNERLTRGSGLYVGHEGVTYNHHFLLPDDGVDFKLLPGPYTVRVYAKKVTDKAPFQLAEILLTISESQARDLQQKNAGIYFDWGPDQQAYHAHVDIRKSPPSEDISGSDLPTQQLPQPSTAMPEWRVLELTQQHIGQPLQAKIAAIDERTTAIQARLDNPPPFKVVDRSHTAVTVDLGDRELDLEPSAYELLSGAGEADREKILRKIRRSPFKSKWMKGEFLREIDDKERLRFGLDGLVGEGNEILSRVREAELKLPPGVSLAETYQRNQTLMDAHNSAAQWEGKVYGFLKEERPAYAEEFRADVSLEANAGVSRRIQVKLERLLYIKRQV